MSKYKKIAMEVARNIDMAERFVADAEKGNNSDALYSAKYCLQEAKDAAVMLSIKLR